MDQMYVFPIDKNFIFLKISKHVRSNNQKPKGKKNIFGQKNVQICKIK